MSKLKKALEKAKIARKSDDESPRPALIPQAEKGKAEYNGEVHVVYTETKVIDVDPNTLRKNKVISLFHNDETTDQLKILRTQVLSKLKEIGGNSLLVTSARPREGKTFTAINLGISIAQELNRTVLIIDADLRHHLVPHYDFCEDFLEVCTNQGLSDYLLGQAEIPDLLLNPGIQRLTMLPGGRPVSNSAELLGSARMESLVTEIKNRYSGDRIIIFDSASLLTCSDPMVLSRFTDGILFVVEAERTSSSDLKRALELLKDKPILGTLLNKAKD